MLRGGCHARLGHQLSAFLSTAIRWPHPGVAVWADLVCSCSWRCSCVLYCFVWGGLSALVDALPCYVGCLELFRSCCVHSVCLRTSKMQLMDPHTRFPPTQPSHTHACLFLRPLRHRVAPGGSTCTVLVDRGVSIASETHVTPCWSEYPHAPTPTNSIGCAAAGVVCLKAVAAVPTETG